MNAIERRKQIIEVLCERRSMRREILADMFGVSTRTIERDVLELSLSYPSFTQQGNGGGIYIDEGYYLGKQYLSEEQERAIQIAMESVPADTRAILASVMTRFQKPKRREEDVYQSLLSRSRRT